LHRVDSVEKVATFLVVKPLGDPLDEAPEIGGLLARLVN
jgi:hypothetical protein